MDTFNIYSTTANQQTMFSQRCYSYEEGEEKDEKKEEWKREY